MNEAVTNDMLNGLEACVATWAGAVRCGYELAVVLANVAVSQDKLNEPLQQPFLRTRENDCTSETRG
jgi:hypothetical protein